jgi:alpha-beta hydrolase superfamily lysophospholipase
MADDVADMLAILRARHAGVRMVAMGESMGGAVLMHLATRGAGAIDVSYVMLAPAVWGRARMNPVIRASLAVARPLVPGMMLGGPPSSLVRILPTDNRDALIRLANNPLHIRSTRTDTTAGLVDLMDIALAAAPNFRSRALFLYGANDDLVPKPATRATWATLPPGPIRRAYYSRGYHLLLRDLSRAAPIEDIIAWINTPDAPLPSGAEAAAHAWMSET